MWRPPSKTVLFVGSFVGFPTLYYTYDRYELRRKKHEFIEHARPFGLEPLTMVSLMSSSSPGFSNDSTPSQSEQNTRSSASGVASRRHDLESANLPWMSSLAHRTFSILIQAANQLEVNRIVESTILPYIEPIWTAGGVDYECLEISVKKHVKQFDKLRKVEELSKDLADTTETNSSVESSIDAKESSMFDMYGTRWYLIERLRQWYIYKTWQNILSQAMKAQDEYYQKSWHAKLSFLWNSWWIRSEVKDDIILERWKYNPPSIQEIYEYCYQRSTFFQNSWLLPTEPDLEGRNLPHFPTNMIDLGYSVTREQMQSMNQNQFLLCEGLIGASVKTTAEIMKVLVDFKTLYPKEYSFLFPNSIEDISDMSSNMMSKHDLQSRFPSHTKSFYFPRMAYLPLPEELFGPYSGSLSDYSQKLDFNTNVPSWMIRLYWFFNKRKLMDFYGNWALDVLKEKFELYSNPMLFYYYGKSSSSN